MKAISNDELAALAAASLPRPRPFVMETEFEALAYMLRDGLSALSCKG